MFYREGSLVDGDADISFYYQMSLYFDLLAPLCCGTSYEEYVTGQYGAMYSQAASYSSTSHQESQAAR